jgi:hypothetical protein
MAAPTPPPIAHVRSVADIEQELAMNPLAPGEVEFKLIGSAPLEGIDRLRGFVRVGHSGYNLKNPQRLDSKDRMNVAARDGVDAMINQFISHADRELDEVDACIGVIKARLALPDAAIPYAGVPLNRRGRHMRHCVYPPSRVRKIWIFQAFFLTSKIYLSFLVWLVNFAANNFFPAVWADCALRHC